jgi:hypothetical protein
MESNDELPTAKPFMKTNLLTRRQFTRTMLATAGAIGVAPAFLRGQNLNKKLNSFVDVRNGY